MNSILGLTLKEVKVQKEIWVPLCLLRVQGLILTRDPTVCKGYSSSRGTSGGTGG